MEAKTQKATGADTHSSPVEESASDTGCFQKSPNPKICLVWAKPQDELIQKDGRITAKESEEKLSEENLPKEQPAYETYILYNMGWKDLARERTCTEIPLPKIKYCQEISK